MADAVIVCCKYLYSWPTGPGQQGPDGACSGSVANVCEEGSTSAGATDPLRQWQASQTRQALCYSYTLGSGEWFARAPCDAPPANSMFIGTLGNGMCCYIVGSVARPRPTVTGRSFQVANCTGPCNSQPAGD